MKQIQNLIRELLRSRNNLVDKEQKTRQTEEFLAINRRRLVAETPIGFKSRTSSEYFSHN